MARRAIHPSLDLVEALPGVATIEEALAAHESRNRELVKFLTDLGDDPTETRPIQLQFWSGDRFSATALAKGLRDHGFDVTVSKPAEPGGRWSVEAELNGSVVEVTASGFVERYVRMAAEHAGEFEGWSTPV